MNAYMQNATDEIYRIFDILNKEYFNNSLKPPIITFQKAGKNNYGHFTLDKVWVETGEEKRREDLENKDSFYEININPLFLNRNVNDIVGTLLHEMVHYYNTSNNIKDCSGMAHNKKFKAEAERVGLVVSKGKSCGYGLTENSDKLNEFIKTKVQPDIEKFKVYYVAPKHMAKKTNTYKYVCPVCGIKVRGKAELSISCNTCGQEMEMEE